MTGPGPGVAVLAPLTAAACYGVASVVQQAGARRAAPSAEAGAADPPPDRRLGPGLLVGLVRQPLFLLGLGLDAVGFVLAFVGLRHLPVFVVQAALSSTVAVTAVLGSRYLADRLSRTDWALVAAVVLGLALVGVSAAPADRRPAPGWIGTAVLLAGLPALGAAALLLDRRRPATPVAGRPGARRAAALGALSSVGFGGFALAGRLMPAHSGPAGLLADPVLWAAVIYAVLGLAIYGAALQRGSVTAVTAAAIAIEALFPSAVGLLLLSDHTRPGQAGAALAGFVLTVGAALMLAQSRSDETAAAAAVPGPGGRGSGRPGEPGATPTAEGARLGP
jgi:drug/metabolite transporter (DMT)-like permease